MEQTELKVERLGEILVRLGSVSAKEVDAAIELQRQDSTGRRVGEILVGLGHCSAGDLARALAEQYDLPVHELRDSELDTGVMLSVPAELAYRHQVLPLARHNGTLTVAIADPTNLGAMDDLRFVTGQRIEQVVANGDEIRRLVEEHYLKHVMSTTDESQEGVEVVADTEQDIGDVQSMARDALVVRLVNLLLRQALMERASDIHIEPFDRDLRIRFRVDGVLQERPAPARRLHAAVISRVKIMADLDIAERRLPQDGRIQVRVGGKEIDLRISTVPTIYGESVVMRLLDRETGLLGLARLGFTGDTQRKFENAIKTPYGIILSTGPTGSGKTTSLYAALQQVASATRKVITIEDPVEYRLNGVVQIQARPKIGLTFAEGLRHILRQDPDVIMVGEIRDKETAEIAVHSALTGHLVFSTLHTNDAPSALPRLIDMGAEPYLVASSVEAVLAQRLVRRLCPHCKEPYEPTTADLEELGLSPDQAKVLNFHGPRGCDECRGTGYSGRVGLFELLLVDDAIKELVMRRSSSSEIKEAAQAQGLRTLREEAWLKVIDGVTSVEEVTRVTHEDEVALGVAGGDEARHAD